MIRFLFEIYEDHSMKQYLMQKRLANKDMHTLYEHASISLERLSLTKLIELEHRRDVSEELRREVRSILWKRLDPKDKDAVEV